MGAFSYAPLPVASMADVITGYAGPKAAIARTQAEEQATRQRAALEQQQASKVAQEIEMRRRAMQDQEIMRGVLATWDPMKENADALVIRTMKAGGSPALVVGTAQKLIDMRKDAALADKDAIAARAAKQQQQLGLLGAIQQAPPEQREPLRAQAVAQGFRPEQLADDALPHTMNALKVDAWWLKEANEAQQRATHAAQQKQAEAQTAKLMAEQSGVEAKARTEQLAADAQVLAAAARQGAEQLTAAIDELPVKRARPFLGLKTAEDILRVGLTPKEQMEPRTVSVEKQYIDEYLKKHPGANLKEAVEAYARSTQKPPQAMMLTPTEGGGYQARVVSPGQTVAPGAVTPAGASAVNVPTAATRTMAETAPKVVNLVDRVMKSLDSVGDAAVGPVAGRWNEFLTGKVGAPNAEFAKLRGNVKLLQTLLLRMHVGARGGQEMLKHFESFINASSQSPENIRATMELLREYAADVAQSGKVQAGKTETKSPPPPPPEASGENRIRVRRKADGRTGTIESKDFDAAKYEKL